MTTLGVVVQSLIVMLSVLLGFGLGRAGLRDVDE